MDDNIKLICGNCLEEMKKFPNESVDLVLTDPPYNISEGTTPIYDTRRPKGAKSRKIQLDAAWDKMTDKEFLTTIRSFINEVYRLLKPSGTLYCFTSDRYLSDIRRMVREKMVYRQTCVWIKSNPCIVSSSYLLNNQGIYLPSEIKHILRKDGGSQKAFSSLRDYNGEVYEISLYGINLPLTLTPEHKLFSLRPTKKYNKLFWFKRNIKKFGWEWIAAKNLKVSDYLMFSRKYRASPCRQIKVDYFKRGHHVKKEKTIISINKDLMELLGWYVAEGHIDKRSNQVNWTLGKKEEKETNRILNIVYEYFGIRGKYRKDGGRIRVKVENNVLCAFIKKCISGSAFTKIIDDFIMGQPLDLLLPLVKAFCQGDGCIYKNEKVIMSTISRHLAGQIFLILLRLGYAPSIRLHKQAGKKGGLAFYAKNDIYIISLHGNGQTSAFRNGSIIDERINHRSFVTREYVAIPVRTIKKSQYNGKVYDFSTSDNTIATLNGIIHNCPQMRKVKFMHATELFFLAHKEKGHDSFRWENGQRANVFYHPIVAGHERTAHPTQKPLWLMKELIKYSTKENDTVMDPFMGSGTTGAACKEMRRRFIGIEISKEYHGIAEKRINNVQGSLF